MNRKLKNLGIFIVPVLAVAAMSSAPSLAAEFHADLSYPLTGEPVTTVVEEESSQHEDVDTFKAGTVQCTGRSYTGALNASTSSTISLAPSYSQCTAFGFVNAQIDVNGCVYIFHIAEANTTDISCPTGKSIIVTAFNCHITIGSQSGLGSVTYSNEGSGNSRDMRISWTLANLNYTQQSKSFPGCTNSGFSDGKRSGQLTLKASAPGPQVSLWYE